MTELHTAVSLKTQNFIAQVSLKNVKIYGSPAQEPTSSWDYGFCY